MTIAAKRILNSRPAILALLSGFCLTGAGVALAGYLASGLMSSYPPGILPYFYCIESIFSFLLISFGSRFLKKNSQAYILLFFIASSFILILAYALILLKYRWVVLGASIFLLASFLQIQVFMGEFFSRIFNIREFRYLANYVVVISGVSGVFFALFYSILIRIFSNEVLLLLVVFFYIVCLFIYILLKSLTFPEKKPEKVFKKTASSFFIPLLMYAIIVAVIVVLVDYCFMVSLKHNFDKKMMAVVTAWFNGGIGTLLVLSQILVHRQFIQRFGVTAVLFILPFCILILGVMVFIFPSLLAVVLFYGVLSLILGGAFVVAASTIINTIPLGSRYQMRTLFSLVPSLIGRAVIASGILFLLGPQYASIRNVILIVIIFGIFSLILVPWIRKSYGENLKNQVEQERYLFFEADSFTSFDDGEKPVISELGRQCSIRKALKFYEKTPINPVSELIQGLFECKDIVNINARIKILSRLSTEGVEEALMALSQKEAVILFSVLNEAIAHRALMFKISENFRNFLKKALDLECQRIVLFKRALQIDFSEHFRLELESRFYLAQERFLYLFSAFSQPRAVLNAMPKIQKQIFVRASQEEHAMAVEYLDTLSDRRVRPLLEEAFERPQSPILPEEFKFLIGQDPWLLRSYSIVNFIPGGNMNTEEKILFLRRVKIFSGLPAEALEVIAESLVETRLRAGEVIFQEGEEGDRLYLLVSGSVEIKRDEEIWDKISQYGLFGELSLLDNEPRAATARAITDIIFFSLYQAEFNQLLEDLPSLSKAITLQLVEYLRRLLNNKIE